MRSDKTTRKNKEKGTILKPRLDRNGQTGFCFALNKKRGTSLLLRDYIREQQKRLEQAGVENAGLDARLLIAHALDLDRAALIAQSNRLITKEEIEVCESLLSRREKREPVHRILSTREFWGLSFSLNPETLEPRPDSETLIEAALTLFPEGVDHICDLGTGTGCLLLSLLHEWTAAHGVGVDLSSAALEAATKNAHNLNLADRTTFLQSNWLEKLEGQFDLIICNPPYIRSEDMETLQEEVRLFDPPAALDGGKDGLNPYRALIPHLPSFLTKNGVVLFEYGRGQEGAIRTLLEKEKYEDIKEYQDLSSISRCLSARKPE